MFQIEVLRNLFKNKNVKNKGKPEWCDDCEIADRSVLCKN